MRLRGEDTDQALRDWFKSEIKDGPRQGYDLGKFFFSVSAATIGALATIEKLNPTSQMDATIISAFVLLFVSILVAVDMARPRRFDFGGETDLLVEYERQINVILCRVWFWLALWLSGTLVGGYAVRS